MKVTPTTIAISACAVLLAMNLIATTSPAADNENDAPATGPPQDPYVVKILPRTTRVHYRVWSDGRVDMFDDGGDVGCDYQLVYNYGPVEHPFPVVDAIIASNNNCSAQCPIMMTYEDGRVDIVKNYGRCTIAGIGTPSLCIGDVDRNGVVGIEDFLIVLSEWGCQ